MGIKWRVAVPESVKTEYAGTKLREYYLDPQTMMETQLKAEKEFNRLYGIPCNRTVSVSTTSYVLPSVLGLELVFPEDGIPMPENEGLYKSIEEAAAIEITSDIRERGLIPWIFKTWRWMDKNAPDDVTVSKPFGGGTQGPFTSSVLLRGHDIFTDVYDNPDRVHIFLNKITVTAIKIALLGMEIRGNAGYKLEGVGFTDDFGGLLSPDMYKEFSCRYMKMYADFFEAEKRNLHSEILKPDHLKYFSYTGITSFDGGTGSYLTYKDLRSKLDIPAENQLKTSEDMLHETPEGIKRKFKEMVKSGARNITVELCRGVPRENVEAFVEIAREYE